MSASFDRSDIRNLVSLDIEGYRGNVEDAVTILTERFDRDIRRRADWTYGLTSAGRDYYRREIVRQCAETFQQEKTA